MKKRILTLLAVLAVLVGALSIVGMAAEPVVETLSADVTDYLVTTDMTLNLAGKNITNLTVEAGVKLVLQDSVGDGEITNITGGGIVELANGYMNFAGGNMLTLKTAGISLQTKDLDAKGASLYYTSTFAGNAAVKGKISSYGVAMYIGSAKNLFAENTYTVDDAATWETNGEFHDNGVLLAGVLKTGNAYSVNKLNATRKINSVPYVAMADGTRITGATATRTMQQVVEAVVTEEIHPSLDVVFWDTLSYEKKDFVLDLYGTFSTFMSSWDMGRVAPLFNKAEAQTYYIYDKFDAEHMPAVTGADIQLMANVDMEGAAIDGLTGFTGSFNGNGNTISNVTINGVGFIDNVAAGQTIENLHLRDVNVVVPADSEATAVGTIAGTNNGTITGVTASGFVTDNRKTLSAQTYYGALVGNNTSTITPGSKNDLVNEAKLGNEDRKYLQSKNGVTVYEKPSAENFYGVANLAAAVGFKVPESNSTTGLVGAGYTNANVYWRDHSNNTAASVVGEKEYLRRLESSQYMNDLGSISWTTNTPLKYIKSTTDNSHIHNQTLSTGVTYYGTPYAHSSSPLEQAKFALGYTDAFGNTDNNATAGVLRAEFAQLAMENGYGVYYNSNRTGVGQWIGNDCSSAVAMAWQRVSSAYFSATAPGVKLLLTQSMVPSEQNQKSFNFQIVGDYTVDDETMVHKSQLYKNSFTGSIVEGPVTGSTAFMYTAYDEYQARYFNVGGLTETVTVDGQQKTQNINFPLMGTTNIVDATDANGQRVNSDTTIYESYAQAAMGDVMVMAQPSVNHENGAYSLAGHAMLVVGDPVTIRNGNGDIDAAKSFMIISEQGAGLYDENINSSWRVNAKYSYQMLLKGPAGLSEDATFSKSESGMRAYLPITMRAYKSTANVANMCYSMERRTAIQAAQKNGTTFTYNVAPNATGNFNSNHRILNATLKIWDYETYGETCPEDANLLYKKTSWQSAIVPNTSDRFNRMRGYRIPLDMNDHFADYATVFTNELGFGKGLTDGNTYAYTVSFTLSNGAVVNGFMDTNLKAYDCDYYTFEYVAPAA